MANNKKPVSQMSEQELLAELVEKSRKTHILQMILSIAAFVAVISVIVGMTIVVPKLLSSLEALDTLSKTGTEELGELSKIDFDALNEGIADFNAIVSSLAKWFGR